MFFRTRSNNRTVPDAVQITLKYKGRDVDDGSMPVADVIVALQGFSGAYSKIASRTDPDGQHQIRITDVSKSSFAVIVLAWVDQHKDLIVKSSGAAIAVATMLIKLIDLKKKNKGEDPSVRINGDGNIVLAGKYENVQVVMPKELYEDYKSKGIDAELEKIARPLSESRIESAELSMVHRETGIRESAEITFSDKKYFQPDESSAVSSKPIRLVGTLVSLNKESNRGTFRMQNGNTVRYHLTGTDPTRMYGEFVYKGPVAVECVAYFDEDLEVKSLDITSIDRVQMPLSFEEDPTKELRD